MINKLFGSVFMVIAPISAALLFFITFQFRLAYLTNDKGRSYHVASYLKIIAALALIGFLEPTTYWEWCGLMLYFVSDAFLTFIKYRERTRLAIEQGSKPKGIPYRNMLDEQYLFRFIPLAIMAVGVLIFSYVRVQQKERDVLTDKRFDQASKERRFTARKVSSLADRASEFIIYSTAYINYQIEANQIRDQRIQTIQAKLGIPLDGRSLQPPNMDSLRIANPGN